nr:transposase [Bathymodiolus platifrons methanotrophic gill symbiont]
MILLNVRWYLAYPLSYRNLEEIAEERGYHVDHSTLNRWVINYAPELEKEFHKKKRPVNRRWRMDETYIKVKRLKSGKRSRVLCVVETDAGRPGHLPFAA